MLATSAVGLATYKFLKRTFVRERPFIRHAGISLAQAPARSLQLPVGPHAARGGLHLAGLRGIPGAQLRAGAAGAGHRRFARGARTPLSHRRARRRLVRRDQRRHRRGASRRRACGYCSSPTSTFHESTASPPRSAPFAATSRARVSKPFSWRRNTPVPRPTPSPASFACPRAACRSIPKTGAFIRGALKRVLNAELAARVDLVHIHTPFIAHYAAARFARAHRLPLVATYHTFFEDYLHHYVPVLPRGIGRFLARHFTRSQCDDVAALISPSAPMREALLAYGVKTPIEVLPTGLPADSYRAGRWRALPPAFPATGRSAAAALRGPRRLRKEHRLPAAHVRAPARAASRCAVRDRGRRAGARAAW